MIFNFELWIILNVKESHSWKLGQVNEETKNCTLIRWKLIKLVGSKNILFSCTS